jgi:SAM-dependent methyltransferase
MRTTFRGKIMSRLAPHAALPTPTRDETARQDFVRDLRRRIAGLGATLPARYQKIAKPAHERRHGPITSRHDARAAMEADSPYQLWSLSQRISQELNWASVIDTVERALDEPLPAIPPAGGTLRLDPDLKIPGYLDSHDIHLMPGNYHGHHRTDPAAGMIYDLGVHIWGTGGLGPENEILGVIASSYHASRFEAPARLLDMGCAIGNATLSWARTYPQAEVHAIDTAASCLMHGHRRAEALGLAVHFSQQNAEQTDFPDAHFDVVVSHLLLHETSGAALLRILAESRRLLRPGGVALHFDAPPAQGQDHFADFLHQWEVWNNNEQFLNAIRDKDIPAMMKAAGFAQTELAWAPGPSAAEIRDKGYFSFPAAPVFLGIA